MPKTLILLSTIVLISFYSCKKDEDSIISASKNNFKNLKGSFLCSIFFTYQDPMSPGEWKPYPTAKYTGFASTYFYDSLTALDTSNLPIYLDGGTVKINGQTMNRGLTLPNDYWLTETSNQNYFQNIQTWEVSGKASIPPSIETINIGFPILAGMSEDTIDRNQPYTISLDTLLNCDSIQYYIVPSPQSSSASLPGSVKSFTFQPSSWSHMSQLTYSYVAIRIKAFRFKTKVSSGRNYYYANSVEMEKIVWFK